MNTSLVTKKQDEEIQVQKQKPIDPETFINENKILGTKGAYTTDVITAFIRFRQISRDS